MEEATLSGPCAAMGAAQKTVEHHVNDHRNGTDAIHQYFVLVTNSQQDEHPHHVDDLQDFCRASFHISPPPAEG